MQSYSLTHVSDAVLLRDLAALIARDRRTMAEILAHIAEVDSRRLYAPAGYSSMHGYCVGELGLSEDAAFKRIQAARAARQFPELFAAVADGRLQLTGVCLLAPHLRRENGSELIEAASGKRKLEIEAWLATRFGRSARLDSIEFAIAELAPAQVDDSAVNHSGGFETPEVAPAQVEGHKMPEALVVRARLSRAKLRYAQALLSHAIPSGDVDQVLDRALDALIHQLERRKIGVTARPRAARPSTRRHHVPRQVRRAVWERDSGQCTFVGAASKRCEERRFLEFDHIEPVARGGRATVDNLRLRCRTHNQLEAERHFGAGFMERKRLERMASRPVTDPMAHERTRDVLAGLRKLGCRPADARQAAEYAATIQCPTLEESLRAALRFIGGRVTQKRGAPRD